MVLILKQVQLGWRIVIKTKFSLPQPARKKRVLVFKPYNYYFFNHKKFTDNGEENK